MLNPLPYIYSSVTMWVKKELGEERRKQMHIFGFGDSVYYVALAVLTFTDIHYVDQVDLKLKDSHASAF